MSYQYTHNEIQRTDFVESLHKSLKKQANRAIAEHNRFAIIASAYIDDGLNANECAELLMIDGLSHDAALSYAEQAINCGENEDMEDSFDNHEYTFQFEDIHGKRWSSFDIGKTVRAANEEDAWIKAEELLNTVTDIESESIMSVNRIS